MKVLYKFWVRSLPFTIGIGMVLVAMCFLVEFYDNRLQLDDEEFWTFVFFFAIGMPLMLFGIDKLSNLSLMDTPRTTEKASDEADAGSTNNSEQTNDMELADDQLMEKYGISVKGDRFVFRGYPYKTFDDAVAYARSRPQEE